MGAPTKKRKLLEKLLGGSKNVRFDDLVTVVEAFGFHLPQVNGGHHIHPQVPELVNLQNKGGKAKPYQVRQFLTLVEQYNLQLEEDS